MIDWTNFTCDPLDHRIRSKIQKFLLGKRQTLPNNNYEKFLIEQVRGKSVLDIGICEHTVERMQSPNWKHRLIVENAAKCVGIDIIQDLVNKLAAQGFNVLCQDATADAYLGQKFDVIHIGDVIEHVSEPAKLLNFAARHVAPKGKIFVRTPNPHNFDYYRRAKRNKISVENMEHISYIVPFHALELARRTNLNFEGYWTLAPGRLSKSGIFRILALAAKFRLRHVYHELFGEPNTYTTIFVYSFSNKNHKINF